MKNYRPVPTDSVEDPETCPMTRSADYLVSASCFEPAADDKIKQRRDALGAHLSGLLASIRPDLIVLPELSVAIGIEDNPECSEMIDGPTVTLVSEIAASASVNICVPILERDNRGLHNSAVYLDRSGRVAGLYRKQMPTAGELRRGIIPGGAAQPPVVVDGVRIGTAICFDENFPDQIWHWIDAGVDLLVFPAYTFAGELMRGWALNCGVPLVCAFPWESVIYDRDGSVPTRAGSLTTTVRFGHHPKWIAARLDMRRRIYHLDGNQMLLEKLTARYAQELQIRLMVQDGRMMISYGAGIGDIEAIEHEFNLVPLQDYLRESRRNALVAL